MKNPWIRALLPLMVTSLLVACGQSSDDGAPVTRSTTPPAQQPVVQPKQEDGKGGGTTDNKDNKDGKGMTLPKGNGATDETTPDLDKKKVSTNTQDQDHEGNTTEQPIKPDPNQTDVSTATGFTGASGDYLRKFFVEQSNLLDAETRNKNMSLAGTIENVRARIDQATGRAILTVKFMGDESAVSFTGRMHRSGVATLSSDTRSDLSASFICLDRSSSTCYTSAVRLETKEDDPAVSYVIVRHTSANADFHIPKARTGTNDALKLMDLFTNTEERLHSLNTLQTIFVESFEVVNGASGVKVSILSKEHELITAAGPLEASEDGAIDVEMARDMNMEELTDLEDGRPFKTGLQQAVTDMHLIGNDGRGNLEMLITVGPDANHPATQFQIGVHRIETPVLTLNDLKNLMIDGARH